MGSFDISEVDLEMLKQVDFRTVDPAGLTDISSITINEKLPREKRTAEFIAQVKNPYCFKVGKIVVGIEFSDNGVSFEQRMDSYLF